MIKNKIIIVSFFIILASCGFKVVNKNELIHFYISEIKTSGDKRISYKIKNKLSYFDDKKKVKNIRLELKTKKIKSVKEKNIKNEITKYKLEIISEVNYKFLNRDKQGSFVISVQSDYTVAQKYSQTQKNQADVLETLTDELSAEIRRKLSQNLNDL